MHNFSSIFSLNVHGLVSKETVVLRRCEARKFGFMTKTYQGLKRQLSISLRWPIYFSTQLKNAIKILAGYILAISIFRHSPMIYEKSPYG